MRLGIALALLAFSVPAFAQQDSGSDEPKQEPKRAYEKNQKIDFDVTTITGTVKGPREAFIVVRQPGKFDVYMPERANFKRDLAKSLGVEIAPDSRE